MDELSDIIETGAPAPVVIFNGAMEFRHTELRVEDRGEFGLYIERVMVYSSGQEKHLHGMTFSPKEIPALKKFFGDSCEKQ